MRSYVVKRRPQPMHSRRRRIICSSSEGRVSTTLSSVAEQYGQRMGRDPAAFLSPAFWICAKLSWRFGSKSTLQLDVYSGLALREICYEVVHWRSVISVAFEMPRGELSRDLTRLTCNIALFVQLQACLTAARVDVRWGPGAPDNSVEARQNEDRQ